MGECIFCRIIEGELPSDKVYEDDKVLAFRDIAPAAPVHILVVSKQHIADLNGIDEVNSGVVSAIFEAIVKIAGGEGLEKGYRVVGNVGEHAGQTVSHLHFHILGGRPLSLHLG